MEHYQLKSQRGYLLIISAVIIVLISIVATLVTGMFTGGIKSAGNTAESSAAFYLANSGLQIAKRDIVVNKATCGAINGSSLYTNATLTNIPGQYTVNCCTNKVSTTLSGNITNSALVIPLANIATVASTLQSISGSNITLADASHFAASGVVKIDSELMFYSTKSSNTLQNVTRGVAGTSSGSVN